MKKHKILSLLLALVLAFSAAGTAFAVPSMWPTTYGIFSGSSSYNAAAQEVTITTSLDRNSVPGDISLRNSIQFYNADIGKYEEKIESIGPTNQTSLTSVFPFHIALGWVPTRARCYYGLYMYNSSENSYIRDFEKFVDLNF